MAETILLPEEMKVDQYVTVLRCESFDKSFQGDVLKIKAIQLPFLIVHLYSYHGEEIMNLDTRRREFIELSKEYVDAFLHNKETPNELDNVEKHPEYCSCDLCAQ